jgi:hypothetical protein
MDITPEQAAEALRDAERARSRSIEHYSYRIAAPQLIMAGVFWILGYGLTDLYPRQAGHVWLALGVVWAVLSFLSNLATRPKTGTGRAAAPRRFVTIFLTIWVFIASTAAIMQPRGSEMGAFVPMLMAAIYMVMGLWLGWRYSAIGGALAVLTLGGFFLLPVHFLLWMAFVGGGALILTGLWLRSA